MLKHTRRHRKQHRSRRSNSKSKKQTRNAKRRSGGAVDTRAAVAACISNTYPAQHRVEGTNCCYDQPGRFYGSTKVCYNLLTGEYVE
jgi:hypothetical protein